MLISGLEEVLETTLCTKEVLDGELLLGFVVEDPFAVYYLEERPVAGVDGQLADLCNVGCIVAPATGAGCHNVQEGCARCVDGFLGLLIQVLHHGREGGLCHIGYVVGCDDLGQILAALQFSVGSASYRSGRGVRKHGCSGGTLDTGVHIGAVVITYVDHVVSALHGAGQRLKTYVVGSAVSAEGDELER